MSHSHVLRIALVFGLVPWIAPTATAGDDVPARSIAGQTLQVPEEQLDLGEVYHVVPGPGTQLAWTHDAPLVRVLAICNRAVGYFVTPFDIEPDKSPVLAGALRIPVASLKTGRQQYDGEFHGPRALNAGEYPEITLRLQETRNAKLTADKDGRRSFTLDAVGELTVRDKTIRVSFPLQVQLVPFTWQTMRVDIGDLLIVRGEISVKTADLGFDTTASNKDFLAETATLDLCLMCSTVSPENNLDPAIKDEHSREQMRFFTLLRDFNDPEKGYKVGRAYMRTIWDDAQALNRLAQATLTEEDIQTRDLAFILRAARRANELTEFKDAALLCTLAHVQSERGDPEAALKWARAAEGLLEGAPQHVAAEVRGALARYEERCKHNQDGPLPSKP